MRVKQLAKQLGITEDTVRFYTRIGLIIPKKNQTSGYKEYEEKEMQRLNFIISARQLGFSVVDISEIIKEAQRGRSACPLARQLIVQRLKETEKSFSETVALRKRMQEAVKDWNSKPDLLPNENFVCHLIENFASGI